ncbi:hypothetical protein MY10362_009178 [Beauveria mimosiformis]
MADIDSLRMANKPELQQDLAGKVALWSVSGNWSGDSLSTSKPGSLSPGHLLFNSIEKTFDGKLDILINNAAYYDFRQMGELDADYVQKLLLGNVHNLIMLMETCFKKGLIQPNSRIVNVSSDTTRTNLPFPQKSVPAPELTDECHSEMFVFTCTKAAMESLTRSWSDILSHHETTLGTTVNTLAVGPTATDALLNAPVDLQTRAAEVLRSGTSVAGGVGHPQDIADIAGLLASEKSRWINGSVVCATGGLIKIL